MPPIVGLDTTWPDRRHGPILSGRGLSGITIRYYVTLLRYVITLRYYVTLLLYVITLRDYVML